MRRGVVAAAAIAGLGLICGGAQATRLTYATTDNPYCDVTTYTLRDVPEQAMSTLAAGRAFPMTNTLGRYDMRAGKLDSLFVGSNGTLQEACFVPRSRTAPEGDGYLVGVYSNLVESRSELIVVDAPRMQELARVILPFRISEQVHGVWAPYEDLPFQS